MIFSNSRVNIPLTNSAPCTSTFSASVNCCLKARCADRNEARLAAQGEPDELAQYNDYLSKLQQRNERQG